MANESGDLKLLGNFRKLIDLVSADVNYKPSNATLAPAALGGQHVAALTSAQHVPAKLTTDMTAISDREAAFAALNPRITRVHGVAKSSGADLKLPALQAFADDLKCQRRRRQLNLRASESGTRPARSVALSSRQQRREHGVAG